MKRRETDGKEENFKMKEVKEKRLPEPLPTAGPRKRDEKVLGIPINELVDMRLQGKSFDEITYYYQKKLKMPYLSKMMIYGYYVECQGRGYDGYEPIPISTLQRYLRGTSHTLPEIANLLDLSTTGLKNYLADRNIGRTINVKSVRRMLREGKTINYIAQFFGMSHQGVRSWMKRNGMDNETVLNNTLKKQMESKEASTSK